MTQIQLSEDTFKKLVELKNHWSFHHRRVTNTEVIKLIEEFKMRVFGYNSSTPVEEIERIANSKTRDQLEEEADRFAKGIAELLKSGHDFEPEYTIDEHIKKMLEVINDSEDVASPVF
ncbi:MAG: hypothetical protein V3T58_03665 [Candidatus Hydrothermarchaeales archaeon]